MNIEQDVKAVIKILKERLKTAEADEIEDIEAMIEYYENVIGDNL